MTTDTSYVLTLRCDDQPGIVHALSSGVLEVGGNILDSAQFFDASTGRFFVRLEFSSPSKEPDRVEQTLRRAVTRFEPELTLRRSADRHRALIMVSKFDHCLVDLLYRHEIGELPIEIPLIVSNHETCGPIAKRHGIPYEHVPVSPDTKPEAERRLLELVDSHDIDLVVLARYMQVLSDETCAALSGRAINIHHSFLPAFKGARPYHQAFDRGVKLIGATAHYVTADLDEGPIIDQDVVRVGHADSAERLAALGRDVERLVLSRAVSLHAQDRVLLNGSRTVVLG